MRVQAVKIVSLLMTCLLTIHLGACSSEEKSTEESIQPTDDQDSATPPAGAASDKARDAGTDAAIADANSSDFTDPKQVQLNEPNSAAAPEPSQSDKDVATGTETSPAASLAEGSDSIPAPAASELEPASGTLETAPGALTLHFAKNSARIGKEFHTQLKELGGRLKANRKIKFTVAGHCDARGTPAYNRRLALKRAQAVKTFLVELGASSKQINVVSYGKEHLATSGHTESEHAQNRRVEIEIQ